MLIKNGNAILANRNGRIAIIMGIIYHHLQRNR